MGKRRKPEGIPVAAILTGTAMLEHFVNEWDFIDKMFIVRRYIARVFVNAGWPGGRQRGHAKRNPNTSGYIVSAGEEPGDLANCLLTKMGPRALGKIYSADDLLVDTLPYDYSKVPEKDREYAARYVCYELIIRQLIILRDEEHALWYDQGWTLAQHVMDEYLISLSAARRSYFNDRTFHGRPRRDRACLRRIGYASGVSVGSSR